MKFNKELFKNKFIIALCLAIPLFCCLVKLDNYRNIKSNDTDESNNESNDESNDESNKENKMVKYAKIVLISYIISLILVFVLSKGMNYFKNMSAKKNNLSGGSNQSSSTISNQQSHNSSNSVSGGGRDVEKIKELSQDSTKPKDLSNSNYKNSGNNLNNLLSGSGMTILLVILT